MIAGDHDGADVRIARDAHGLFHLGARRIDHADKTEQDEIFLDRLRQFDVRCGHGGIDAEGSWPASVRVAIASTRSAWLASSSLRLRDVGAPASSSATGWPCSMTWRQRGSRISGAPFTMTRSSAGLSGSA